MPACNEEDQECQPTEVTTSGTSGELRGAKLAARSPATCPDNPTDATPLSTSPLKKARYTDRSMTEKVLARPLQNRVDNWIS